MRDVEVQRTIKLFGDADCVVEIIDGWEGIPDVLGVRFGCLDGEGGTSWSTEDHVAIDVKMARGLAAALIEIANAHQGERA